MDFHTLNRRELQSLCKKNKIPANMTNLAMADALQALQIVEGLEDFIRSKSETGPESPEKLEIGSPQGPRTAPRTTTRRKQTPAVPGTRKRAPKAESGVKGESSVQTVYGTRRSTRLVAKMAALSLSERGRTGAVKIGDFGKEMATEESLVEISDDFSGVSENKCLSGDTQMTLSERGGSERLNGSEAISGLKMDGLKETERGVKSVIENHEEVKGSEAHVMEEKLEEGSGESHSLDPKLVSGVLVEDAHGCKEETELEDTSEVCKGASEYVVLPSTDSVKPMDIIKEGIDSVNPMDSSFKNEGTAVDINNQIIEKIEPNNVPVLSNSENPEGIIVLESNRQDSYIDQVMGSGDSPAGTEEPALSSLNMTVKSYLGDNPDVESHFSTEEVSFCKSSDENMSKNKENCGDDAEIDLKDSDLSLDMVMIQTSPDFFGENSGNGAEAVQEGSKPISDISEVDGPKPISDISEVDGNPEIVANPKTDSKDTPEIDEEQIPAIDAGEVGVENESGSEKSLWGKSETSATQNLTNIAEFPVVELKHDNSQVGAVEFNLSLEIGPCVPASDENSTVESSLVKNKSPQDMDAENPMLNTENEIKFSNLLADSVLASTLPRFQPTDMSAQRMIQVLDENEANSGKKLSSTINTRIQEIGDNKENIRKGNGNVELKKTGRKCIKNMEEDLNDKSMRQLKKMFKTMKIGKSKNSEDANADKVAQNHLVECVAEKEI